MISHNTDLDTLKTIKKNVMSIILSAFMSCMTHSYCWAFVSCRRYINIAYEMMVRNVGICCCL